MSIRTAKIALPFYPDTDGTPLEAGYVYIGKPGLNPMIHPITAYWDIEGTIPAEQPIRTIGGHPSRSGSIGSLVIPGPAYSLIVRNKNGALVFSDLSVYQDVDLESLAQINTLSELFSVIGSDNAYVTLSAGTWIVDDDETIPSNITLDTPRGATINVASGETLTFSRPGQLLAGRYTVFTGSGTVVGLTTQYPEWHGAAGDGSTDDSSAFNAMDFTGSTSSLQYKVELAPGATYQLDSVWDVDESIWIEGNCAKLQSAAGITALRIGNSGRVNIPRITRLRVIQTGASTTTTNGVTYATNGTGIRLENVAHAQLIDVHAYVYQYGLYLGDTYGVNTSTLGIWAQNCQYGIYGTAALNGSKLRGDGGEIQQCYCGIALADGTNVLVEGFIIETCVFRALDISNVEQLGLSHIYTEDIGDQELSSTSITFDLASCTNVEIVSCDMAGLQGATADNKHPLCCLNMEDVENLSVRNSTFSYGQDSHVIVDENCHNIWIDETCRGTHDVANATVRIQDNTPLKEVRHRGVTSHFLGDLAIAPAPNTVNYIVNSVDLSTTWSATNATVAGAADTVAPDGETSAYSVAFTSAAAACFIKQTTATVTDSETKKLRCRFWAKLISRDTTNTKLPAFRVAISTITPGAVVERPEYPISEEWAFYDFMIDQFTKIDGSANTLTGDTAVSINFENRLLGDLITVSFWGIQISRYDDPYYDAKVYQTAAVDADVAGGSSPVVNMATAP